MCQFYLNIMLEHFIIQSRGWYLETFHFWGSVIHDESNSVLYPVDMQGLAAARCWLVFSMLALSAVLASSKLQGRNVR